MIDPIGLEGAAAEFPELVERMIRTYGYVPNSLLTMAHKPVLLQAFTDFAGVVLGDLSAISVDLRWMIAHMASRAAGCRYCQAHTGHNAAELAGLDPAKFDEIWNFEHSERFDPAERAALRVAVAGATVPNAVDAEMFSDLEQHYSTAQIIDIVAVLSLFGFLNRWNDTMATSLESDPTEFATEHLAPQIGWQVGKHRR